MSIFLENVNLNFQTFDLLGGGLRDGLAVRNNPGGGTLSITNHLDILRERLLRQIAKNRSKKPVRCNYSNDQTELMISFEGCWADESV